MFTLFDCYVIKLNIKWDKTVLMEVFEVRTSSELQI